VLGRKRYPELQRTKPATVRLIAGVHWGATWGLGAGTHQSSLQSFPCRCPFSTSMRPIPLWEVYVACIHTCFAQYSAWRGLSLSSWQHAIKVLRDITEWERKENEKPWRIGSKQAKGQAASSLGWRSSRPLTSDSALSLYLHRTVPYSPTDCSC
jgi:hypothetical protein